MPKAKVEVKKFGIPVSSAKEISSRCTRALQKKLEISNLRFQGEEPQRGESELLLSHGSATTGFAERTYPTVPFLERGAVTFWLAVALKFVRRDQLLLTSASILLFEGSASDPEKKPLLRAEWHEWESPDLHAQPHWHVYASVLEGMASTFPEGFNTEEAPVRDFGGNLAPNDLSEDAVHEFGNETVPVAQKEQDTATRLGQKLAHFHYAMSAQWHTLPGRCQERLVQPDMLVSWLSNCTLYIRDQLIYITR